jgi:hypothetical protein
VQESKATEGSGAEHPYTLVSMANLAQAYRNQDRLKEAEGLQAKLLETCSKVSGAEHSSTLASMNVLASTYRSQECDGVDGVGVAVA